MFNATGTNRAEMGNGYTLYKLSGFHLVDGFRDDSRPDYFYVMTDDQGVLWSVSLDRSIPYVAAVAIDIKGAHVMFYDKATGDLNGGVSTTDGPLRLTGELLHYGLNNGNGFMLDGYQLTHAIQP